MNRRGNHGLFASVIFFASLFAAPLFADCKPVDLNTDTVLKDMPVLDQDGAGLCYAFASAQLLEFKLRSAGTKFSPSSIDLALANGNKGHRASLTGGLMSTVLDGARQNGVSSRQCVDQEVRNFTRDTGESAEQFVTVLEAMNENSSFFFFESYEKKRTRNELLDQGSVSSCSINSTINILSKNGIWGSSVTEALNKVLYKCAGKRTRMPPFKYVEKKKGSDDEMKKTLNLILDKKIPAGLSICAAVLDDTSTKKNLNGKSPPLDRGASDNVHDVKACGPHGLLAVGRGMINGKCQYLLRNSWGGAWKGNGHTCACKTPDGGYYADCEKQDSLLGEMRAKALESGKVSDISKIDLAAKNFMKRVYVGCWVDEANLASNLIAVGEIR